MLRTLLTNSSSNVGLFVLKLVIAFFLTPVIVHALGNHDYGINEMVLALIGYMGLLEIGLQPAVTRFVARYSASGTQTDRLKVYSSAVVFALVVGFFVALVLFVWAFLGAKGLPPENAEGHRYVYFLLILAMQVLISFPGHVFLCIHQGHQRYSLPNMIAAVNTVVGTGIVYYFLKYHDYGLLFLTLVNAIGVSVKFLFLGFLLKLERYGSYKFRYSFINLSMIKELLIFGVKSFWLGISSSFSKRASPILIGWIINPAVVVFYVIPNNLIGYLSNLVSTATLNFMPYFSSLHAQGDTTKTRDVFIVSSRYVAGLSVCGFVSAAFLGPAFLHQWIGAEYAQKGAVIIWLASLRAILKGFNPFHGRVLTGMNLHGALAKLRTFEAILFLVFALAFAYQFGIEGVAFSALIAGIITEPVVLSLVCRQIDLSEFKYIKNVIFPLLLPLLSLVMFYYFFDINTVDSDYLSIFLTALIGCLIYFLLFFMFSIGQKDKTFIIQKISRKIRFKK